MICQQFALCVQNVQQAESPDANKERKKKKGGIKKRRVQEKDARYINYPCGNPEKLCRCVSFLDQRSRPSCSENGKTYTLDHSGIPFEVLCMRLDGGVIDSAEISKCDYAFFLRDKAGQNDRRAIFIELKGTDTKRALLQLQETLCANAVRGIRQTHTKLYGRIVNTSGIPRIQSTEEYLDLKELLMHLGGNLKVKEWHFIEKYEELDEY